MYYSDTPIALGDEDLLGRRPFAKLLAQSLINLKTSDTFSIGLFGKWGSGKTSVVNMTLHELEALQQGTKDDERMVVVHFEPWNFSTTDQLLSQFFVRLSNEFRSKKDDKLIEIADSLDKYSDAFDLLEAIPYFGRIVSFVGKSGAKGVSKKLKKGSDEKDIQKRKENIVNLLANQSKHILVVIDDIDRLSSEQIRLVFQLIASVAKFPNTMYLLVFDKDIVASALQKVQEGSGEDYLEKIIQMPIQIPDIQKDKIRKVLVKKLTDSIAEYTDISFQQERWQRLFSNCIEPFINNLRDVNRLCNTVQFKLASISSEIDFVDMVAISALEISLPSVYEWVKGHKAILTESLDASLFSLRYKTQEDRYAQVRNQIYDLLQDDAETNIAIDALSNLFPYFARTIKNSYGVYDLKQLRRDNCIAHPDKFDRYFDLDLNDAELKKSDIANAVYYLDCEEFKRLLLELDATGSSYDFLEEVDALIPMMSPERVEIIIDALFNTSAYLNRIRGGLHAMRAGSYAEHMILNLLDVLNPSDRLCLLENATKEATLASLPSIASTINMLELGYGRLAANGEQREYKKVISLDELLQLEKAFAEKAKGMLKTDNLFDFSGWRRIHYLLEWFDPDYMKAYLTDAFKSERNVVLFLGKFVSEWVGSRVEYEIISDYQKYLTDDCIIQAIEKLKATGDLFLLPLDAQRRCGAFYIKKNNESKHLDNIPQKEADKLLDSWKASHETA